MIKNLKILDGKNILITGGTGSFGSNFLNYLLKNKINFKKIIIFSRDELKQSEMLNKIKDKRVRFFLGDVRDFDRLRLALEDVHIVIHAAALKQVTFSEYNPIETIKTNILGAQNLIQASLETGVEKVIALSTDKAASPINLYGATKLCSDKLFIAANNFVGKRKLNFSIVRYGNVMGSRGSVIPIFLKMKEAGVLNITHKEMTRFNITMDEAINLVILAIKNNIGGEILVPKIPSYTILDVAKAVSSKAKIKIIGKRPGEKLHEEMIPLTDIDNTVDAGKYYIILPEYTLSNKLKTKYSNLKKYKNKISYNSKENKPYLSIGTLKKLIRENIK